MRNASAMNEVQVVLEEYLGRRKAESFAKTIFEVKKESIVDEKIEELLMEKLEENDIQECLKKLKRIHFEFETLFVPGSNSPSYVDLMSHIPKDIREKEFLEDLKTAINAGVKSFKVPVYDPSIDKYGNLQFIAGAKPAVNFSYNELEELATRNGCRLGTKNEYILFCATIMLRLIKSGLMSIDSAFIVFCSDSTECGNYNDYEIGLTGTKNIVGKCDLANTSKILKKDEEEDFWIASGSCYCKGNYFGMIASMILRSMKYDANTKYNLAVGWFVV